MNNYYNDDAWTMRKIFMLSDHAYIRMIDHIFNREYADTDGVWKEWQDCLRVGFRVAGTNRYEFQMQRRADGLQICAEDKGCVYYCGTKLLNEAVQIRDPDSIRQEGFQLVKEYEGGERILLSFRIIELGNDSAWQLEEQGLVIFLPFLFDGVIRNLETKNESTRQETLKSFVIHDIVGALGRSYQRGNLTSFDVQKLKQICRQMAWKILGRENWMQSMENQELILDALEADVDFLERASRIHPLDSERK